MASSCSEWRILRCFLRFALLLMLLWHTGQGRASYGLSSARQQTFHNFNDKHTNHRHVVVILPAEAIKLLSPHCIFMVYIFVTVFLYTYTLLIVQCICMYESEINSFNIFLILIDSTA